MKKILKIILPISLLASAAASFLIGENDKKSTAPVRATEVSYPTIAINEFSAPTKFTGGGNLTVTDETTVLASATYTGATYTYNSASSSAGSYGYKTRISAKSVGVGTDTVSFSIADTATRSSVSSDSGYCVVWSLASKNIKLKKDGTELLSTGSGVTAANDKQFDVEYAIVDVDDSTTQLIFKINNKTVINYSDSDEPLKPTSSSKKFYNCLWTTWHALTIYNQFTAETPVILPLNVASRARPFANATVTINSDSVVIPSGGYSGVTYTYANSGSYGYTAKIHTPNTTNVIMYFVIGDSNAKTWTYSDKTDLSGYTVKWYNYGTKLLLTDNVSGETIVNPSASVTKDADYLIEFSLTSVGDGFTRICFSLNGTNKINLLLTSFNLDASCYYNTIWTQSTVLTVNNDSVEELDLWQNDAMHMEDPDFEGDGTGACYSNNLYVNAKAELLSMGKSPVTAIELNDGGLYQDAHDRYLAWAHYCGDLTPFEGSGIVSGYSLIKVAISNTTNYLLIIFVSLATASLIGFVILFKKKYK